MKYRQSGPARNAALVSLTLALMLSACTPPAPDAGAPAAAAPPAAVGEGAGLPMATPSETPPAPAAPEVPVQPVLEIQENPVQEYPVQEKPAPPAIPVADVPAVPTPASPAPTSPAPVTPTIPPSEAVAPIPPSQPSTPHVSPNYPEIGTYTFPDEHISFDVPSGWAIQAEAPAVMPGDDYPYDDHYAIVHIFDDNGHNVADIQSGVAGGVVGGPVSRTIVDSQKLTSFDSARGASWFAVFRDDYPFTPAETRYFVGVVPETLMTEGPDSTSAASFLIMGNGGATASANINPFMTQEEAETWMKSAQFAKLKAMLTSLHYAD